MSSTYVQIEGRRLRLSNLDKVLYPSVNFTKAEMLDYYFQIADFILPHLRNRCITLKRYPEGVEKDYFYEKQCPSHHPEWINTRRRQDDDTPEFCIINDLPSLIWAVNLASIEMHPLLSYFDNLEKPSEMVFDLDPGPDRDILDCGRVALGLNEMLGQLGLKTFVKTSGGKGLHLYIPLNTTVTFEDTKSFAHAVALTYEKYYPDIAVSKMNKQLRKGKVFIDWSQNDDHKTTVCVYSLRAMEKPTISMPVEWEYLDMAINTKDIKSLIFTPRQTIDIVKKKGDIFAELLEIKQKLPHYANSVLL